MEGEVKIIFFPKKEMFLQLCTTFNCFFVKGLAIELMKKLKNFAVILKGGVEMRIVRSLVFLGHTQKL